MTRHVSTENLARFRDGDLRSGGSARVRTHLESCARCREVNAALGEVPDLLAAAEVPPIPAHLAARIETALATESAHRAADAPSMRASGPEHAGHQKRSRPHARLPFPAVRLLAAAATVVVIGGGGYELVSVLGGSTGPASTSSGSAASSAGGTEAHPAHSRAGPAFAVPRTPDLAGTPVFGPPVRYQSAGHAGTIRPVRTAKDYRPAQLTQEVGATLAEVRKGPPVPGSHAGTGQDSANGFGTSQLAQLAGCLSRVAAGRPVLLVDVARFRAAPATVIVTAARGPAAAQVWVVGPGCSRSAGDVLAHQALPTR